MTLTVGEPLSDGILACTLQDGGGHKHTFAGLLDNSTSVILFLRHFGCIGCSENVRSLAPRFAELDELGVNILLVGCGPAAFIDAFRERQGLLHHPVRLFTDTTLDIQKQAGLLYGLWGGFRPKALFEMVRAFTSGHTSHGIEGDIRQQAGALVVDQACTVLAYHKSESLGDHVQGADLVQTAMRAVLKNRTSVV